MAHLFSFFNIASISFSIKAIGNNSIHGIVTASKERDLTILEVKNAFLVQETGFSKPNKTLLTTY